MMRRAARALPALALLLILLPLAGPGELHGQSLFSSGGLGRPNLSPDGRARALGGIEVGLKGVDYAATDPSGKAWILLPGISMTVESEQESLNDGDTSGRTRFPAFGAAYPQGKYVYSLGFTGLLSQDWRSEIDRELDFGGGLRVDARDRFEGKGGIGSMQAGVARLLGSRVAVGVTVGSYLGSLERTFNRELDPGEVGSEVETFSIRGRWQAEGLTASGSASWDVTELIRLGAGFTWSGDLSLVPTEETTGETLTVPLPLELRAGAHATLTPGLALVASWGRADWSEAAEVLADAAAPGVATRWGTGVEWSNSRILGRRAPLALGWRSQDLPFSFRGAAADESAITLGLGVHLAEVEGVPLAQIHWGLERGTRSAGLDEERFWRSTVTVRLSGR
jgi:hypothetical protein